MIKTQPIGSHPFHLRGQIGVKAINPGLAADFYIGLSVDGPGQDVKSPVSGRIHSARGDQFPIV